jgi:hypothetical protein
LKLARCWLALAGLGALGCPLLVDDRLEVVPANEAVGGAATPLNVPKPEGGAPSAPECGVSSLPPASSACPAVCDRCEEGRCVFECATDKACEARQIACPKGLACRVECTGNASCNKAVVSCVGVYACDLDCSNKDACKELRLRCGDGNCNVRCTVAEACDRAVITCGSAQCGAECSGPMGAPELQCGPACACNPC